MIRFNDRVLTADLLARQIVRVGGLNDSESWYLWTEMESTYLALTDEEGDEVRDRIAVHMESLRNPHRDDRDVLCTKCSKYIEYGRHTVAVVNGVTLHLRCA